MDERIFLNPGDYYFAESATRIETILGSCVSLTMRDPVTGHAAMCHCLLPSKPDRSPESIYKAQRFHYVDTSVEDMLNQFRARSIPPHRLEIKLFGGANVVEVLTENRAIGSLNWKQARRSLEEQNLSVSAHDVGGNAGRRIIFETEDGSVMVRRLRSAASSSN
jgi:chemotaxis protein CheD